jgi:hypothetical protein
MDMALVLQRQALVAVLVAHWRIGNSDEDISNTY